MLARAPRIKRASQVMRQFHCRLQVPGAETKFLKNAGSACGTRRRAFGPSAINAPMAIPAAGQKTATPPGLAREAKPNRAAMK
jgi:hypothetical protein